MKPKPNAHQSCDQQNKNPAELALEINNPLSLQSFRFLGFR